MTLERLVKLTILVALTSVACSPLPKTGDPAPKTRIGFLFEAERPNLVELLPPPPTAGTPAARADQLASERFLQLMNTARWELAIQDAAMRPPGGATVFTCAAGVPLAEETTPLTVKLMRTTAIEVAMSTRAPKKHFQRPRPFMLNEQPVCTPTGMKYLEQDGSYPSGHSAAGWTWGLLLAELLPEKADALLQRGRQFGQSRAVCNVHWQSDVEQGRIVGSVLLARLHGNAEFRAAVAAAREELTAVKARKLPLNRDCGAEAAALALE